VDLGWTLRHEVNKAYSDFYDYGKDKEKWDAWHYGPLHILSCDDNWDEDGIEFVEARVAEALAGDFDGSRTVEDFVGFYKSDEAFRNNAIGLLATMKALNKSGVQEGELGDEAEPVNG
jgi:hypothetical protein